VPERWHRLEGANPGTAELNLGSGERGGAGPLASLRGPLVGGRGTAVPSECLSFQRQIEALRMAARGKGAITA